MQRPVGPACRAWSSLRHFLMSKYCQAGVQLAAGELVVSLFFWHSELRYSSQCLLSTLYLLCCLLIPPDNHIGSKWVTSVLLVGSAGLACLLAGTTASLDLLACTQCWLTCASDSAVVSTAYLQSLRCCGSIQHAYACMVIPVGETSASFCVQQHTDLKQ